jgi:AbrB family looped-hinge helix DNA binding protein
MFEFQIDRGNSMAASAPIAELIRVKERFQVTIPSAVRRLMKISEGDFVEMRYVNGEIRIRPRAEATPGISGADWYRDFCEKNPENPLTQSLTDADLAAMVKQWR